MDWYRHVRTHCQTWFCWDRMRRHRLKFLALLIVNICLLGIYNKLENQDLNLENIRAHVKVFFRSGSSIKATPAPTWNEVGNVFLKRSLWKETASSNNSQISGCTPPKVGVTDLLFALRSPKTSSQQPSEWGNVTWLTDRRTQPFIVKDDYAFDIFPAWPLGPKHPPVCLGPAPASVWHHTASEAALHEGKCSSRQRDQPHHGWLLGHHGARLQPQVHHPRGQRQLPVGSGQCHQPAENRWEMENW